MNFAHDGEEITARQLKLEARPRSALVGEGVSLRVSGCRAGQVLTFTARTSDARNQLWRSYATFRADSSGVIDVGLQPPLSGTYAGADSRGLLWSMVPEGDVRGHVLYEPGDLPTQVIALRVSDGPTELASVELERHFSAPGLHRTQVREKGLVGSLFAFSGSKGCPCVITLGGSEGGLREGLAKLLGSYGFAALALAYFGVETLPEKLVEIPLEYFERAMEWLSQRPEVDPDRMGVIGGSKGGELALLLGSLFPQVRAVIAGVPSGLVWQGIDMSSRKPRSSWTYRGEPIPFVPCRFKLGPMLKIALTRLLRKPMVLRPFYSDYMKDQETLMAATIPVERINGPVLLVSGQDDQLWPSTPLTEIAFQRLMEHEHPHYSQHLSYPQAGHVAFGAADLPVYGTTATPSFVLGGTLSGNARARADSWPRVVTCLQEHL